MQHLKGQHRGYQCAALLVMDVLMQQAPAAYAQSLATWLCLSWYLDQTGRADHLRYIHSASPPELLQGL